jgi:hypothetical protein
MRKLFARPRKDLGLAIGLPASHTPCNIACQALTHLSRRSGVFIFPEAYTRKNMLRGIAFHPVPAQSPTELKMDLEIRGRKAIIFSEPGPLATACQLALAAEGAH